MFRSLDIYIFVFLFNHQISKSDVIIDINVY